MLGVVVFCCLAQGGGVVLRQLREGHIVNLFMKVDKEHPGNNGDIIYYTIECGRELFCKVLKYNNRLVQYFDKKRSIA